MHPDSTLKLFVILLSCLTAYVSFGQNSTSTEVPKTQLIPHAGATTNAMQEAVSHPTDSLQSQYESKLNKLDSAQDRLLHDNKVYRSGQRIDSIQSSFYHRSDSLKNTYKNKLIRIDSSRALFQKRLDSLTTLKLPTNKISQRLDSLNHLRENTVGSFEKKLQYIKDSATSKLKKLDLSPEVSDKLNAVTKNIEGVKISGSELNIPALNVPGNPLGNVGDVGKLNDLPGVGTNNPLSSAGVADKVKMPDGVGEVKEFTKDSDKISEVSGVTDQVKEYSKEAQEVTKSNLDAKKISTAAEEKAVQVSGIKEIESQTKALDEYKAMTAKAQDPEALKKEAVAKAKQVAVNHFAGKEEQLKAAMEKISKYKQKYSSLNSLSEVSKKRPNEMRSKPLIERIVPGIAFQMQRKGDDLLVDFNPYAGYRFTSRLRAGIGWNQRIGYNTKQYSFNPDNRVFGPRAFGEYKLGKGFSPRLELEVMNTGIPPLQQTTYDPEQRAWVWGAFVGMKKEYKVFNNIKGTAMIMTRLFNYQHKSPYADILNVRFGFEFPFKGKKKN